MDSIFTFRPLTLHNWSDFEAFFESKGSPHYCWCSACRRLKTARANASKQDKKKAIRDDVFAGIPVGILAYVDDQPVAWCSVAPRDSFRPLKGVQSDKLVWSIVCFFIRREYRKRGLTEIMIKQAIIYAKKNGGELIEAYPANPDSVSYRYMGIKTTFEKLQFQFVKNYGAKRSVMLLRL